MRRNSLIEYTISASAQGIVSSAHYLLVLYVAQSPNFRHKIEATNHITKPKISYRNFG
jgi:hypothetical protein